MEGTAKDIISFIKKAYKPKELLIGLGESDMYEEYILYNKSEAENTYLGIDIKKYGPMSDDEWEVMCWRVNVDITKYVNKRIGKEFDKVYANIATEKGLEPKDGRASFENFKSGLRSLF